MIQAVIFDMDGLMIDSEPIQSRAIEAVIRSYGKEPILNEYGVVQNFGMRAEDDWGAKKEQLGITEDTSILIQKKSAIYTEMLKVAITVKPGLQGLIRLFQAHGLPMAIGSSSSLSDIHLVVHHLGLETAFTTIVSGQDVTRGKPAPDIFLEAAKRLQIAPINCLVLEDALSGVEAGVRAGMKVIAVPNQYVSPDRYTQADRTLGSLADITWEMIQSL